MDDNKIDSPFLYKSKNLDLSGSTETDRRTARLNTIFYWVWRILVSVSILIAFLIKTFS